MKFRETSSPDNQELINFCKKQYMQGVTQVTLERSPDFFDAMTVEGDQTHVFCAEIEDQIAAIGTASEKQCLINGEKKWLGYLGNLRVDPKYQKGTLLPRAYRFMRKMQKEMRAQLFLTTIMEENIHALKVLTSGKGGLPPYKDIGQLISYIYGVTRNPFKNVCPNFLFRNGKASDAEMIANFLNQSDRQFMPLYSKDNILNNEGLLKGLNPEDFYLCFDGDELIGCLAAWDQTPFRRWKVQSYNNWIHYARPFLNFFAKTIGLPYYPPEGKSIPYSTISCMRIKDDNELVCEALLSELWKKADRNNIILTVLHEKDPLNKVFKKAASIKIFSRLFLVYWGEQGEKDFNNLDDKVPYIEPGSI
jgi:hypothetical protein